MNPALLEALHALLFLACSLTAAGAFAYVGAAIITWFVS